MARHSVPCGGPSRLHLSPVSTMLASATCCSINGTLRTPDTRRGIVPVGPSRARTPSKGGGGSVSRAGPTPKQSGLYFTFGTDDLLEGS